MLVATLVWVTSTGLASPTTSTASVIAPTCRVTSTVRVAATSTRMLLIVDLLKPCSSKASA